MIRVRIEGASSKPVSRSTFANHLYLKLFGAITSCIDGGWVERAVVEANEREYLRISASPAMCTHTVDSSMRMTGLYRPSVGVRAVLVTVVFRDGVSFFFV